ncbi:hypothetical protein [Emticicia agri]|uniref:H-type lectin domain-containing protein n=1 Tax=Emticicia agri TaxID=2492393 RepID=A0A4Q5LXH5_9BACT|nr:hypothetical protein [Emticicia agri]RYU94454.1 hypothetical protein EWM59_16780 [Emticicia agri]
MKKFVLLLIIFIPLISLAQSGIILPNSIDLPKVTALATCGITEKGKMVYRITDNKAYYCNGTAWQEMTGGGFNLPYSGTGTNTDVPLFRIINNTGTAIWAEGDNGYGIYAQSNNTGLRGVSIDRYAVHGTSTYDIAILGVSSLSHGVFGTSNGVNGYGIYGTGINGRAGYFDGNLKVANDLIVNEDKGIIQNSSSTQLKHYSRKVTFNHTIAPFSTLISDDIPIATFSAKPVVYIGDIENQLNDYYKIILSIVSVDENSIRIRLYNSSNTESTFTATWNIIAVGPK